MDTKKSIKFVLPNKKSKKGKKSMKFKVVTKKQEKRLESVEEKRNRERALYHRIQELRDSLITDESIHEKSLEIFKKIVNEDYTDNDLIDYEALVTIIEDKNFNDNGEIKGSYYPDYSDKDFNKKIYKKFEFYLNRNIKPTDLTPSKKEELSQQLCNPLYGDRNKENIVFNLTKNQKFLKAFLSPQTPYNSMLLYHGTGVGKTCSSISIAEQYSDELERLNKKIVILLNPSIQENFLKNIFNINKLKEGMTYYQCTGEKYLREIPDYERYMDNLDVLERKIKKIIRKRYEFYGYQTFANIIEKLRDLPNNLFEKKIKEKFSDCVFIIDEVHNIKEGDDLKVLPPLLEKVFKITDNMKLLLLSATPMYDTSKEIIFLMNLMLTNDGKAIMKEDEYFDSKGYFRGDVNDNDNRITKKFVQKTRGYVSFVRGKNPLTFPLAIYPEDKLVKPNDFPINDKDGITISENERIKDLKIIACPMNDLQKKVYEYVETDKSFGAFNQPALMCSNVVFPVLNEDEEFENFELDRFIGDVGLNNILSKSKVNKNLKYSFKHAQFENIFTLENIKNYSSKIYNIVKNVNESTGIVFIYSQFINAGIIPLALALETQGYKKLNSSLLSKKYESKQTKGNYIIISGNNDLSKNAYKDYIKLENQNKNGEKVKIIIGSQTAAEGLDFKYIREIHILDPWFHYNRIEQIIGRGIRNCSHIDLSPKERNVKIFLYASTKSKIPKNENETIDMKMYRFAEIKTKQMAMIEYLLKVNSVDCNLNREYNIFDNDKNNSRECNYRECNFKCLPENLSKISNIDYETSSIKILEDQINDIINLIKFGNYKMKPIYNSDYYFTYEEIKKIIEDNTSLEDPRSKIIFLALHKLVTNNIKLQDKNKNLGTLMFRNKLYIFVPDNLKNKIFTYNDLKQPLRNKINKLDISNKKVLDYFKNNNNTISSKQTENSVTNKSEINLGVKTKKMPKFQIVKNKYDKYTKIFNTTVNEIEDKLQNYEDKIKLEDMKEEKKKVINKEILAKMYNYIYSLSNKEENKIDKFDYITTGKDKCLEYLILKSFEKLEGKENELFANSKNILHAKQHVYYKDPTYSGDDYVFGYKIVSNGKLKYYKVNETKSSFLEVSPEEKKAIEKSTLKRIADENKQPAKICGYLEEKNSQNKVIFKIRDKKSEKISSKKTSKQGNKNQGKKTQVKTGSICNNDGMKKATIISFIQDTNKELKKIESRASNNNTVNSNSNSNSNNNSGNQFKNYKDVIKTLLPTKEFLCFELEIYFRYLDLIDNKKRHYYNVEEAIEYKLNEK